MEDQQPKTSGNKSLVLGLVLTALGALLLFWTQNFIDGLLRWWPAVLTVIGLTFLYKVFFCHAKPRFLLFGLLFFLTGTLILLVNTVFYHWGVTLKELWPVFMGIFGFSLIPYAAHYRRTVRVSLVIPGVFLIFLMVIFLLFSFSLVKESLAELVYGWWPLVLLFMGLTLIINHSLRRRDEKRNGQNGDKS